MFDLMTVSLSVLMDTTPDPTEVKAGPLGFAVWIFMIIAVVVIRSSQSGSRSHFSRRSA